MIDKLTDDPKQAGEQKLKAVDGPGPGEARVSPFRLGVTFVERLWGRTDLKPWYDATGTQGKVGEAWLTGEACVVETGDRVGTTLKEMAERYPGQLGNGEFPLLVKMLFPDEKLSVQVHPDDEQARALGMPRGKTECWYVLAAEAGAKVALGLKSGVTLENISSSFTDDSVEELLEWLPVSEGDMVYVDAGTVHAIGPDVVLLEIQQMCDTTYRLYDYGRGRELHLEDGLAVVKLKSKAGKIKPKKGDGYTRLLESDHFVVDRFDLQASRTLEMAMDGVGCVVGIGGAGAVNAVEFGKGQAVVVPLGSVTLSTRGGCSFVRCWEPVSKG